MFKVHGVFKFHKLAHMKQKFVRVFVVFFFRYRNKINFEIFEGTGKSIRILRAIFSLASDYSF